MPMLKRWYYQMLMEEFGPVEEMTICRLIEDGTLSSSDLVRAEDSAEWISVASRSWPASGDASEPAAISDLSELSFEFEESTQSDRRAGREIAGPLSQHVPPEYYSQSLGQILGPMSMEDLIGMAESGALSGSDEVRCGEDSEWQSAGAIAELQRALSLGEQLTAEPVASAPPSTRRLFPTAGKPSEDSANQVIISNPVGAPLQADEPLPEQVSVAEKVGHSATVAASLDNEAASPEQAGSSNKNKPPKQKKVARQKKEAKQNDPAGAKARSKKTKPKMAKKKKPNQEDDKLLNEIFDAVFADDQKAVRSGMPPKSVTASVPTSSPETAAISAPEPGTSPEGEPRPESPSVGVNAGTAEQPAPTPPRQ